MKTAIIPLPTNSETVLKLRRELFKAMGYFVRIKQVKGTHYNISGIKSEDWDFATSYMEKKGYQLQFKQKLIGSIDFVEIKTRKLGK